MMKSSVTTFAYAKVNLALAVLGIREDGYHELQSVMQSIDLHDVIRVQRSGETLICRCGTISGSRNLAYKAAELFLKELGLSEGIEISIDKYIPIQAGLAGGSTDAAAVLQLLNQLYDYPLAKEKLIELGSKCGADVAFCLRGGTMWATGRGECLESLPDLVNIDLVLVKPWAGVNTREAYRLFDKVGQSGSLSRSSWEEVVMEAKPQKIASLMYNDLEPASIQLVPEISDLKKLLMAEECFGALMSGSGSCVFGIAQNSEHAIKVAKKLRKNGF